jgi:hypothetical protein
MSDLDDLLDDIFAGESPALYADFERWMRGSRRFAAFAGSYRVKIRAKLKNVRDEGGMQDLRAELESAALLLREERFTLEYEKHAASKQRAPDFTVTFRTHTPFNVEVRHIRTLDSDGRDSDARAGKLMTVICDKLGQMPPSIVNLLWLTGDTEIAEADLTNALTTLRRLADLKADDFFARRGFASATVFMQQYRHLSGIVLRDAGQHRLWLNPLARHPVLPEIVVAIQRLAAL